MMCTSSILQMHKRVDINNIGVFYLQLLWQKKATRRSAQLPLDKKAKGMLKKSHYHIIRGESLNEEEANVLAGVR